MIPKPQSEMTEVHLNIPQMLYMLVKAALTVVLAGRGTGKSKILAEFLKNCCEKMPQCIVRFGAYTYEGMFLNILPGVIKSWQEDHKYVEGIHFWVGEWPDPALKIPKPYFSPTGNPKHLVPWWNGSVIVLSSMDRVINNGSDFDAAAFDEVRFCPQQRYTEMLRAKRGNRGHFGHLAEHGSVLFTSDRPWTPDGNWLLNYKLLHDENVIEKIIMASYRIEMLMREVDQVELSIHKSLENEEEPSADDLKKIEQLLKKIDKIDLRRNDLRKEAVQFIEASTFENVHALGLDYLLTTRRDSTDFEWNTSILNLEVGKIEDGFYALLNKKDHTYTAQDYDYIDTLNHQHKNPTKPTWRFYEDYDHNIPLHIACDHNNAINWIVTGQPIDIMFELRVQSAIYVKSPDYVRQLIEKWAEFYKGYPNKQVIYYYNHTSIKGNAQGDKSEHEVVIETLASLGWIVEAIYIGQASRHHSMYLLWSEMLGESDRPLLKPMFNYSTCETLFKSMLMAPVIIQEREYKKDKTSERKNYKTNTYKVPPEMATHGSEAMDTLVTGLNKVRFKGDTSFEENFFG